MDKSTDFRDIGRIIDWLKDEETICLDYETSGLDTYSKDFRLAGIALSNLSGESTYVHINSLCEPGFPQEEFDRLKGQFGEFLRSRKRILVYNLTYECAVTLSQFDVDLSNCIDVMMLMKVVDRGGSLKDVSAREFGIQNWDVITDWWCRHLNQVAKHLKPVGHRDRNEIIWMNLGTIKKKAPSLFDPPSKKEVKRTVFDLNTYYEEHMNENMKKEVIKCVKYWLKGVKPPVKLKPEYFDGSNAELVEFVARNSVLPANRFVDALIAEFPFIGLINKKKLFLTLREQDIYQGINFFLDMCERYKVSGLARERIHNLVMNRPKEITSNPKYKNFLEIPREITVEYACLDAHYTTKLYQKTTEEIENLGLEHVPPIFNREAMLAFELERNGVAWDYERALELDKAYDKVLLAVACEFLTIPKVKRVYELTENKIIKLASLGDFSKMDDTLKLTKTSDEAKGLFTDLFHSDTVKVAMLLYHCSSNRSNKKFKLLKTLNPLVDHLSKIETTRQKIAVLEERSDHILAWFKKHLLRWVNDPNKSLAKQEEAMIVSSIGKITSAAQGHFNVIYESMSQILGIDIDDESTWVLDEFKALILMRKIKKLIKVKQSFIHGKMGIKSVRIVKQEDLEKAHVPRYNLQLDEEINKLYIINSNFLPLGTYSKRWISSNIHTVPPGTDVMDLRISRWDGVRIHFDYSQHEVRVLAHITGDEKMLQMFSEGGDFHKKVASQIWNKPENMISDTERRASKGATFSIIYGSGLNSFAKAYTDGNREMAKQVMDGFYSTFVGVAEWIKERHVEALLTGSVKTMWGDSINVNVPPQVLDMTTQEKLEMLESNFYGVQVDNTTEEGSRTLMYKTMDSMRRAQNVPIQSVASHIAADSIYGMAEAMRKDGLRANMDCFTHDAGDIDADVMAMFPIFKNLWTVAVEQVRDKYGLKVIVDSEIGVSGNEMIEMKNVRVSEDYSTLSFGFDGKKRSVEKLVDKIKSKGISVSIDVTGGEEKRKPLSELFTTTDAYSMDYGKDLPHIKGRMEISR